MEAWKRKKKKAEDRALAAAAAAAAAKAPVETIDPVSSEDEELPPPLTFKGKLITLSPGMLVTLLPCETSPMVEDKESIEAEFIEIRKKVKKKRQGKSRRELNKTKKVKEVVVEDDEPIPFAWEDLEPGHRPDTLIVRGLPYKWFDLTPETLRRQKVIPGSSPLRRLLETFSVVYDIDVRPFDPNEKAKGTIALMAGKKWLNKAMHHRSERANGGVPLEVGSENGVVPLEGGSETMNQTINKHDHNDDGDDDASALNLFENDDEGSAMLETKNVTKVVSKSNSDSHVSIDNSSQLQTQAVDNIESLSDKQPKGDPVDSVMYPVDEGSTFEALVQYRTYEGFLDSLKGLGEKEMHFSDPLGFTSVARLTVVCDYSGYFTKEALKLRAAGAKREIQIQARKQAAKDRAELRLAEGARETAQAARVAAVGLELRISDFENEPVEQAWIAKDAKLAHLVEVAKEAMDDVRKNIAKFEGDPVETLVDLAGLATARADCRDNIAEADHRLKVSEKYFMKLRSSAKLELPILSDALKSLGCNIFLELISQQWQSLDLGSTPEGRTLFAPDDAAFLGSLDNWEPECWGLHIIEVPLLVSDMINSPGGRVQPLDRHPKHGLRVRSAMDGRPSIWCIGDSRPPRIALVMKGDVKISGGIIVHVLDRILYPP